MTHPSLPEPSRLGKASPTQADRSGGWSDCPGFQETVVVGAGAPPYPGSHRRTSVNPCPNDIS